MYEMPLIHVFGSLVTRPQGPRHKAMCLGFWGWGEHFRYWRFVPRSLNLYTVLLHNQGGYYNILIYCNHWTYLPFFKLVQTCSIQTT